MIKEILIAITIIYSSITNAADIYKIEISSHNSYPNNEKCNYSNKSVAILAENIVKARGIYIGKGGGELVLDLHPNLKYIDNSQNCIGYMQVEFKYYDPIKIKDTNKSKYGINLICRRGEIFSFSKRVLQEKIEEITKSYIEECLTEIKNS